MKSLVCVFSLVLLSVTGCHLVSKSPSPSLSTMAGAFSVPPDSTRTKVWWFHGETETTREGITADLEAFRRAGVGGVV